MSIANLNYEGNKNWLNIIADSVDVNSIIASTTNFDSITVNNDAIIGNNLSVGNNLTSTNATITNATIANLTATTDATIEGTFRTEGNVNMVGGNVTVNNLLTAGGLSSLSCNLSSNLTVNGTTNLINSLIVEDGSGTNAGTMYVAANGLVSYHRPTTFTPIMTDGTNNVNQSFEVGRFVLNGPMATIFFNIFWSSLGSASGQIRINLPFASADLQMFYTGTAYIDGLKYPTTTYDQQTILRLGGNEAYITIQRFDNNGTISNLLFSQIDGAGFIGGSITFIYNPAL